MPAAFDDKGMTVFNLGDVRNCALSQAERARSPHRDGKCRSAILNIVALRDHAGREPLENLQFQSERAIGRAGDLCLQFAELGGGETHLAGKRLAMDERAVERRAHQPLAVLGGDLHEIAEHVVMLDPQDANTGVFGIARLQAAPDLARALSRLALGRGGPRDLAAIRDGVLAAADLARALASLNDMPAEISEATQACRKPDGMLAAELSAALAAELPAFKRDGGFVREGYDKALDELRALRDESRRVVAALQARYAEDTGIRLLRIKHNNVLGYFVEVTAQHGERLMSAPLNGTFIHRQTLAGQVRFTTTELGELEAKIASAADRALGLELEIFERLAAGVTAQSDNIKDCAAALASLDVASALAELAAERNYARPQIEDSQPLSSKAAGIRWLNRRCRATARRSSPMTAICRRRRPATPAASGSSPAPTWPANHIPAAERA